MFGMSWLMLLGGIGLIWGIMTDNLMWGLILCGGIGWLIDYYVGTVTSDKRKNK